MPYKNHHTAVVTEKSYGKYRRDDWGKGITAVYGINGKSELHEVLFDADNWTVTRAKAWLKSHKISYVKFHKATRKAAQSESKGWGAKMVGKAKNGVRTEVPVVALSFVAGVDSLQFDEVEGGGRRMRVVANSGQPFSHWWWGGKCAFDLRGLAPVKETMPALREHAIDRVIGVFDKFSVKKEGWVCEGPFIDREDTKDLLDLHDQGVPLEASMRIATSGTRIERVEEGAKTRVNGYEFEGPGTIFRQAPIREASFCLFGADSNTRGQALAENGETVTLDESAFSFISAEGGEEMELTDEKRREIATEHLVALSAEEFAEICPDELLHSVKALGAEEAKAAELDRAKALAEAAGEDAAVLAIGMYIEGGDAATMKAALADLRAQQLEDTRKEVEALKKQLKESGQEALEFTPSDADGQVGGADEPRSKFEGMVKAEQDGGLSKSDATRKVIRENPDLHQAYIAACQKPKS